MQCCDFVEEKKKMAKKTKTKGKQKKKEKGKDVEGYRKSRIPCLQPRKIRQGLTCSRRSTYMGREGAS